MMTKHPTAIAEHNLHRYKGLNLTLLAGGLFALLAMGLTPFLQPAIAHAYDQKYYDWCTESLGQTQKVCCTNAGGELFSGGCVDPAVLRPPVTPVPTITQQILPPGIVVP